LVSPQIKRLMTVPGVNAIVAATFLAAVGDVSRFPTSRQLVGYLGLDSRVRQSGSTPATHGRISQQGSASARHALVEAAWSVVRQPGPLRAFYQRIRARRGHPSRRCRGGPQARLPVLVHAHPQRGLRLPAALTDQKEATPPELTAGAPRYRGSRSVWSTNDAMRRAERDLALQAERAYRRTVADWQSTKGAGATPGRASSRQSGTQRDRASVPDPAL